MEEENKLSIEIAPTTGGSFDFLVGPDDSIDFIKKCIAKKLKVSKEQICLLHRDRLLENSKTVKDYGLADGSRVALVPSIETGLVTQRPEQSVLEALEGLNESQVGDFLSGKSPLNLTMRLGDHVMLIQLQLSKGQQLAAQQAAAAAAAAAASNPSQEEAEDSIEELPSKSSLVEASRNLTNTLKKLSSHVTRSTSNEPKAGTSSSNSCNNHEEEDDEEEKKKKKLAEEEITNHMQHHGKGVYSGTFSGTLNPALQDGLGKPKKHVSTIVHILNDLLGGVQQGNGTVSSLLSSSSTSKRKNPKRKSKEELSNVSKKQKETTENIIIASELRANENEQLRVKMEQLKEQLKIRKLKLGKGGGSGQGSSSATSGAGSVTNKTTGSNNVKAELIS